jgi:hypothetical protein
MFIYGDLSRLSHEQRVIVLCKPFWHMRRFAAMLGWHGLRLEWVRFRDEDAARDVGMPESKILVYYLTTDREFSIQINELPPHDGRLHQATVGAFRYGITQLGWHPFELFGDAANLATEAERLRPFLDRQQFRDPLRRAAFKKTHPELLLENFRRKCGPMPVAQR